MDVRVCDAAVLRMDDRFRLRLSFQNHRSSPHPFSFFFFFLFFLSGLVVRGGGGFGSDPMALRTGQTWDSWRFSYDVVVFLSWSIDSTWLLSSDKVVFLS